MKYFFAAAVLVAGTFASFSAALMLRADAAPAGIAVPMAAASPIAAALSLSTGLPRLSWCGLRAVVVVRPVGRGCPYGFVWAYGRCRPV